MYFVLKIILNVLCKEFVYQKSNKIIKNEKLYIHTSSCDDVSYEYIT